MIKLGKYLAEQRMSAGISQKQISDKLGLKSSQYISNVERGMCLPTLASIKTWCDLINCPYHIVKQMLIQIYVSEVEAAFKKRGRK